MKLAFTLALIAMGSAPNSSQPENCAPRERRVAAIQLARRINTAQAAAFRGSREYAPLAQLPIHNIADDYAVQLFTDGTGYSFSIKDKVDACHGAVFSDDVGVIYTGAPIQ
jgi:hypothetical protein